MSNVYPQGLSGRDCGFITVDRVMPVLADSISSIHHSGSGVDWPNRDGFWTTIHLVADVYTTCWPLCRIGVFMVEMTILLTSWCTEDVAPLFSFGYWKLCSGMLVRLFIIISLVCGSCLYRSIYLSRFFHSQWILIWSKKAWVAQLLT